MLVKKKQKLSQDEIFKRAEELLKGKELRENNGEVFEEVLKKASKKKVIPLHPKKKKEA